jgi:hypothetical protein
MNEERKRKLAELEAESREQDRKLEELDRAHLERLLDLVLEPVADAVVEEISSTYEQLYDLDLVDEENKGKPRWNVNIGTGEVVTGIEVMEPEPRLYHREGPDTIIATRMREDGRYESALLDENGLPIKWHPPAYRPDLN